MDNAYSRYWLPIDISTHGSRIDLLINTLHVFMVVLFVGWGIYMVYTLIRFRARPGHKADPTQRHFKLPTYLEIAVALFEVALLIFISYPVWKEAKSAFPDENESVRIRVIGEQFAWNFHYPGKDGKFGRTDITLVDTEDNPVGIDRESPEGKDDIVSVGEMYIPVNTPIITDISSKDVIHSFGVPVLRLKQDAIPGSSFPIWFEATQTSPEEGYEVVCSQLCGVGHTRMRAFVHIKTNEEYQAWLDEAHEEVMDEFGDEEEEDADESEAATDSPSATESAGGSQ